MNTMSLVPASPEAPVAGQSKKCTLIKSVSTFFVDLLLTGVLQITVAATSIRNRGSAAAAFDQLGLSDAGDPVFVGDPRMMRVMTEFEGLSSITSTRLTSTAVATTNLRELVRIPLASKWQVNPRDTAFREKDDAKDTNVIYTLNGTNNGLAKLVNGGTATLTSVSVAQVFQEHDADPYAPLPLFRPRYSEIVVPIASANANLLVPLQLENFVRRIIIQQDSDAGEVTDIINRFTLRTNDKFHVGGDSKADWDFFCRRMELLYGGDVYSSLAGRYAAHDFRLAGRLTKTHNPLAQPGLRFLFDCQPSVTSGATNSVVRIGIEELVRVPNVNGQTGRRVTSGLLPAGFNI